jgi:ribosomal-protein-alanine N-acetyltransferase
MPQLYQVQDEWIWRIMVIPTHHSERLTLRSFTGSDAIPLHLIMDQPEMLRYFPNSKPPELDRVKRMISFQWEHWEKYGYGWWAMEVAEKKEKGRFIGWAGLQFLPDTDEVEVAYMLDRNFWGHGLATEAANEGLLFGFEQLKVDEIVGIVHPENAASIRVIEKLGMTYDLRKPYFGMDCFRYALTAAEYKSLKADNG